MDSKYLWKEELEEQKIDQENNNIIQNDDSVQEQKKQKSEGKLDKKRAAVKNNMPEGIDLFSHKESLVRNGRYSFVDSKGRKHDATRLTPSSKYMKPILDSLKEVDTTLSGKFDPNAIETVRESFIHAIIACENYLDNRNPWTAEGKARKRMVQDFYVQLKHESVMLYNQVDLINKSEEKPDEGATWLDVLRTVRTDKFKDGDDGVEISYGGGGTSDMYAIEKGGKTAYFKENEKIGTESFSDLINKSKDNLSKSTVEYEKDIKNHSKRDIQKFGVKNHKRSKLLDDIQDVIKTNFGLNDTDILRLLFKTDSMRQLTHLIFERGSESIHSKDFDNAYKNHKNMNAKLLDLKTKLKNTPNSDTEAIEQLKKEIEKQNKIISTQSDFVFIVKELESIKRRLNSNDYAIKTAQIEKNEELSKRNVATSRMAKALGLEDIVAKSTMTAVTINGKTMTGISMEEAKGTQANKLINKCEEKKKTYKYTSDSFRQLLSLQVFDLICGQTDRHEKNYMVQSEDNNGVTLIKSIKAIDNDMAFGCVNYSNMIDRGFNFACIKNIENEEVMTIPFIDYNLAMKIKALTPEFINYQMADILSKKERKALISRINGVKKVIDRQLAYEKEYKSKNKPFTSKFVKVENETGENSDALWHKAWDNAYDTYKGMLKQVDKKDVAKSKLFIEKTTYLNTKAF